MKRIILWMAAACLPMLYGCFGGTSVTHIDPVPPRTSHHGRQVLGIITAENRGMFLFKYIPLWSGDPKHPNFRQYDMFTNRLKPGYMDIMLEDEGRRMEAHKLLVKDCTESSSGWFSLWIIWIRQMRCEAIALGKEGKADGKR